MPKQAESDSPMIVQFKAIKSQHEGSLLFYRMGDFYEMFFDDAIIAAEALDIALTKRGRSKGSDIPMCGVPVHSADSYLQSLIRQGFRVAICEQVEDPVEARKRGSRAVVAREVVRLMTPGTLTEEALLEARQHNFLAAFANVRDSIAIAWADISSGHLHVTGCPAPKVRPQLARIAPKEILVSENLQPRFRSLLDDAGASLTQLSPVCFDSTTAERRMKEMFEVNFLDAYGEFSRPEFGALGGIISYLELTQKGSLPLLQPPRREFQNASMYIDAATRRNLEITRSFSGQRENTLLDAVDRTVTAAGARLLETRISAPSADLNVIRRRQDELAYFRHWKEVRADLRSQLRSLPDIERALSRLCLNRGGPRDLDTIRNGLECAEQIHAIVVNDGIPASLAASAGPLTQCSVLAESLDSALVTEPPIHLKDGGFIAAGYDSELDDERNLRDEARGIILELQQAYAGQTSIPSLKVKFNNVLGYFIETPSAHSEKMLSKPLSDCFIHRQTTASATRFTTSQLSEIESRILNAGNRALAIETRIFEELRHQVVSEAAALAATARALAEIDVAAGLAELAAIEDWCKPEVTECGSLEIVGGRHPVVELSLSATGQSFISNDCILAGSDGGTRIRLVTGPNMSGKSTYLRQNALITVLAQAGSFVPASSARIGLVSQLFSRVGAADDLARGRSTFMVEMVETATILNQSDQNSLVILDEIGRGTATYDGLAIAWATLEHLHDVNNCRTLFATHFHELTRLSNRLDRLANSTVAVREWKGDVIFLHEVKDGSADRSYGVQVAKLAGIPAPVLSRANDILEMLEADEREGRGRVSSMLDELPLFSEAVESESRRQAQSASPVHLRLETVSPDELSPREALALLYELRDLMKS